MRIGARNAALLLTIVFAAVVLRTAWIHDDAYITFRTVDNFVHGYGLRWNAAERVQTYTHPLWMLAIAACYFVTREIFFTVLLLSVVLSVATVLLVAFGRGRATAAGCLAVLALILSRAFVDYSTSGLENPLTHVLYAAFLVVFFRWRDRRFLLALLASLAAVNRIDTLLLYVPVLVFVAADDESGRGVKDMLPGFLPLIAWEAFAIFYYGFPFPNTAYAKLFETGVGTGERVTHGLYYLVNSLRVDPPTLLVIGAVSAAAIFARDRRQVVVALGIAAYVAYVVIIGGDFVTGRFLTAPLLGAVVLLSRRDLPPRALLAAAAALVVACAVRAGGTPLMDGHGIADERPYYNPYTGLTAALRHVRVADHPWAIEGLEARRDHLPVAIRGDIGLFGFYAGPDVHVVDVWGLADPLIARLPARRDMSWRVGHFTRAMPAGYPETLASGSNRIADRRLAALYDRLALITRGPLFDASRLAAIWKMNTGGATGD
jgi:arabinofuranosyltransferase